MAGTLRESTRPFAFVFLTRKNRFLNDRNSYRIGRHQSLKFRRYLMNPGRQTAKPVSLLLLFLLACATGFGQTASIPAGFARNASVEGITEYSCRTACAYCFSPTRPSRQHGQHYISGRLAARKLWRDRHGASSRTHVCLRVRRSTRMFRRN